MVITEHTYVVIKTAPKSMVSSIPGVSIPSPSLEGLFENLIQLVLAKNTAGDGLCKLEAEIN